MLVKIFFKKKIIIWLIIGHFIPPLAVRLINNSNTNHINLKGIGIGIII